MRSVVERGETSLTTNGEVSQDGGDRRASRGEPSSRGALSVGRYPTRACPIVAPGKIGGSTSAPSGSGSPLGPWVSGRERVGGRAARSLWALLSFPGTDPGGRP